MMRAIGWGIAVVLLGVAVVAGLAYAGVIQMPSRDVPSQVLVIATAPDDDGAEVAAFAFVIRSDSDEASVLDTMRGVTVAGTSAGNARDAYPFVGAQGVAQALAEQTGGVPLPWIVVPRDVWSEVVTAAGGVTVKVDQPISSYTDGALAMLEPGTNKLDGDAVAAVSAGLSTMEATERADVVKQLTAGISSAFAADKRLLAGYVAEKRATTSLSSEELAAFARP